MHIQKESWKGETPNAAGRGTERFLVPFALSPFFDKPEAFDLAASQLLSLSTSPYCLGTVAWFHSQRLCLHTVPRRQVYNSRREAQRCSLGAVVALLFTVTRN